MAKQIALAGKLVDVRNYATSKSVRLIIEIPAEQAASVISEFGWATPVAPVDVAVARLDPEKAAAEPPEAQEKPKRKWGELTPAQQAGIRCNEPSFWEFCDQYNAGIGGDAIIASEEDAADFVRIFCDVASRADILPGTEAAKEWHKLDGDYEAWVRYGATA